jgi:hypothetical protein
MMLRVGQKIRSIFPQLGQPRYVPGGTIWTDFIGTSLPEVFAVLLERYDVPLFGDLRRYMSHRGGSEELP